MPDHPQELKSFEKQILVLDFLFIFYAVLYTNMKHAHKYEGNMSRLTPLASLYNGESTHKGVNQRSKYVTQVHQQRPESCTVTLYWHACKYR